MPDQVRVPDPHPNRKPATSNPNLKMASNQDPLLLVLDSAGGGHYKRPSAEDSYSRLTIPGRPVDASGKPAAPAVGGSSVPVVGSSPNMGYSISMTEHGWKRVYSCSPGHSSGYSDFSCDSSPARSPSHQHHAHGQAQVVIEYAGDGRQRLQSESASEASFRAGSEYDRPLSLVVRKSSSNAQDIANQSRKEDELEPMALNTVKGDILKVDPCGLLDLSRGAVVKQPARDEDAMSQDSGTEDIDRPLVISEVNEEEEPPQEQETAHDFSIRKSSKNNVETVGPAKEDHDDGLAKLGAMNAPEQNSSSGTTSCIKIKEFAKINGETAAAGQSPPKFVDPGQEPLPRILAGPTGQPAVLHHRPPSNEVTEDFSDVSSECPSLASSADTWQAAASEVGASRPFAPGAGDVAILMRRVSRGNNNGAETVMYQCDFCEKMFANKSHLQSHLVTHTGEKAVRCKVCMKTFGRKSTLRAHMTTHTKRSNFMCHICEKACNDNNSLEEHMRMHTGEKPFVCSICQKAYARKSHLNVHYRVHTGERPFVCHHCDKDFTEKRFLNDHLQTAHNGAEGPLKCPNCSREFAYKTSLKQHLKKLMCERNINRNNGNNVSNGGGSGQGGGAKQFQCPFCEKSYSWKQTLKQHVSMYHRNKVHTDEFWRFELTKNRRSQVDDKVNDDLWKKQLGKHAVEDAAAKVEPIKSESKTPSPGVSASPQPADLRSDEQQQMRWLEQISRSPSQMSTKMKLLALQTLQKSLGAAAALPNAQDGVVTAIIANPAAPDNVGALKMADSKNQCGIISLSQVQVAQAQPAADNQVKVSLPNGVAIQVDNQQRQQQTIPCVVKGESYLSLLAQLAAKESENQKATAEMAQAASNGSQPPQEQLQVNSESPLLPTNEECAVKRTQQWLQQVNKYRSKQTLPKEEVLEVDHDQLWEQQIARVKQNPVRSPLEPVEITLDDQAEDISRQADRSTPRSGVKATIIGSGNNDNNNSSTNGNAMIFQIGNRAASISVPGMSRSGLPMRAENIQFELIQQHFSGLPRNGANNNNNNNNNFNNNNNVADDFNNNNNDRLSVYQAKVLPMKAIPKYMMAGAGGNNDFSSDNNQSSSGGMVARVASPPIVTLIRRTTTDSSRSHTPSERSHGAHRSSTPASLREGGGDLYPGDEQSMLKSLLMDRVKRKIGPDGDSSRSGGAGLKKSCTDTMEAPPQPPFVHCQSPGRRSAGMPSTEISSIPIPIPDPPNDILRNRLLGWKDTPTPSAGSQSSSSEESAKQQVSDQAANQGPLETAGSMSPPQQQQPVQPEPQPVICKTEDCRQESEDHGKEEEIFEVQDLSMTKPVEEESGDTSSSSPVRASGCQQGLSQHEPAGDSNGPRQLESAPAPEAELEGQRASDQTLRMGELGRRMDLQDQPADRSHQKMLELEGSKPQGIMSYTHTSVLKHLLHRYTGEKGGNHI